MPYKKYRLFAAIIALILLMTTLTYSTTLKNEANEAKAAVNLAEKEKTQASVDAARLLVNNLGEMADKFNLSARLSEVQTIIDAVAAVEKAERFRLQEFVDVANILIQSLVTQPDKNRLTERLRIVQVAIVADSAYALAAEAVLRAERLLTQLSVSEALVLVDGLLEGDDKAYLSQRISDVQKTIDLTLSGGGVTVIGGATVSDTFSSKAFVDPVLTVSVNTNQIDFGAIDFLSPFILEDALSVTVQANHIYGIGAIGVRDFQTFAMVPEVMGIDNLLLKASDQEEFVPLALDAIAVLVDGQQNTDSRIHLFDFKIKENWLVRPGQYSTVIRLIISSL